MLESLTFAGTIMHSNQSADKAFDCMPFAVGQANVLRKFHGLSQLDDLQVGVITKNPPKSKFVQIAYWLQSVLHPCLLFQEVHGNRFPIWGHRAPLHQNDLQDASVHLQRFVGDHSNLLRTGPGQEGFVFHGIFADGSYVLQVICQPLKWIGSGLGFLVQSRSLHSSQTHPT